MFPIPVSYVFFNDTYIERKNTCTHAWTPLNFHDASASPIEAESSQSFKEEGEAEAGMFGATLQCNLAR